MSGLIRIAELLADGNWCSGTAMAQTLGVTRSAVSARVRELRSLGLDVFSVPGKGYRLAAPLDLLDPEAVWGALPADGALYELIVRARVDSTNAVLAGFGDGRTRACLAESQSAGRGRADRAWISPFAANLYMSVARELQSPKAAPLGTLSLAIGVRLAEALRELGVADVALKWPNDLWIGRAKLGGILVEHRGKAEARNEGARYLIVGVGINVAMSPDQAGAVEQAWTRLADHLDPPLASRSTLAGLFIGVMLETMDRFEADGFAPFAAHWPRFDGMRDQHVDLIDAHGTRSGIARGINHDGSLCLDINGRLERIYSGDVSLRLAAA